MKSIVKMIKSHKAYNYHVASEAEANATLVDNGDGTYTVDDWGVTRDHPDFLFVDNVPLKAALDQLLRCNLLAEKDDLFSLTWCTDIRGLRSSHTKQDRMSLGNFNGGLVL